MIKGYKDSENYIIIKYNEKGEIETLEVGKIKSVNSCKD